MSRGRRDALPLTVAGFDPTGGAGLGADLKVFLRHGLSGAAVATAWTVQDSRGVRSVFALSADAVAAQLVPLLADLRPAAVKIGLLPSAAVVRRLAHLLAPLVEDGVPLVIDPVLTSSNGKRLLPRAAVSVLRRHLLPLASLLTPNLAEAAELSGVPERVVRRDPEAAIRVLRSDGARAVLVKGGHGAGAAAIDVLGFDDELLVLSRPRVAGRRLVHGTGCALSASIAAFLARGASLPEAVVGAKAFVWRALSSAEVVGQGARFLDFFVPLADEPPRRRR